MRILFLPDYPDRELYSLNAILHHLGYTATQSPEDRFDLAMLWQDTTRVEPPAALLEVARRKPVLNLGCRDIGKSRVEQVFREVFGYGTFLDPLRHRGRAVRKSEENAIGGGELIECPLPARAEGCVYQAFIDSEQDGVQVELRTPVVLGAIPHVKVWRKEALTRLLRLKKRPWHSTTMAAAEEIFTPEERGRILELAARMGLDFGEIDILRSREDGRIYVLDVNKTPSDYSLLNRVQWDLEHRRRSLDGMAACLHERIAALLDASRRDVSPAV